MDLLPSSEQEQIIDNIRGFLNENLPVTRLRGDPSAAAKLPANVWSQAIELGFLGMGIAEEAGGIGYGVVEETLLFRELGRVVGPARFLFSVVGARIAAAAGNHDLTARILNGEALVAYAVRNDYNEAADGLSDRRIFEFAGADLAIIDIGDRFMLLDLAGCNFQPIPCLDRSVSMTIADLSRAQCLVDIVSPNTRRVASVLCGAVMLGIAEATLDMIVEYAKIRTTFGRPIGAYQAVRHPCADMAARCELAKAQLFYAAVSLADESADGELQAASARVLAQDAAIRNTDDNIQLHGGIGVTDDFVAHFFLKRTNVMQSWFGDGRTALREVLNAELPHA